MRAVKRDGRIFDHQTLEAIRRMAVERVREGAPPALHGDVVPDDQLAFAPMMRIQGTRVVQVPAELAPPEMPEDARLLGFLRQ